jgi:hypothetical protein
MNFIGALSFGLCGLAEFFLGGISASLYGYNERNPAKSTGRTIFFLTTDNADNADFEWSEENNWDETSSCPALQDRQRCDLPDSQQSTLNCFSLPQSRP